MCVMSRPAALPRRPSRRAPWAFRAAVGLTAMALGAALLSPVPAGAAPAPGRDSQGVPLPAPKASRPAAAAGKTCHVGSFTGVMVPGSTVCMKIGGFVRAQSGSGGAGHP